MERLTKFLQEHKFQTVLDVGTGAGNFIQLLQQLYSDFSHVVGIDTSEYAVKSASKTFAENDTVEFKQMDAMNMTFEDETFDLVCLSNSLHHLSDMKTTLDEMSRVTKKGGYLLFGEMVSNDLDVRQHAHLLVHHFAAKVDRYLGDTHEDTFTKDEILNHLETTLNKPIDSYWELTYERKIETSDEEVEWLKNTLDRIVSRIQEDTVRDEFAQEAQEIKQYIEKHGFDSATTLIVVVEK